MNAFLTNLKKTTSDIKKHYFLLFIAVIIDIIFFYSLTRLHVEIFKAAADHIKATQDIIQGQLDKLTQLEAPQLDRFLIGNAEFAYHYHQIVKYIGLFLFGLFLILFFLRGTNWFIAHKMADSKITLKEFSFRFIILSILGFIAFVLSLVLYGLLLNHSAFSQLPLINSTTANGVLGILVIIIYYIILVGYSLPHKARLKDIIKSISAAKKIVPAFVLNELVIVLLLLTPSLIIRDYYLLGLVIAVFITIPLLTITRVFFINTVRNA